MKSRGPWLLCPRGPTAEEWARMPEAQRASLEEELGEAAEAHERARWLSMSEAERQAMAETEEHQDATYGSRESLRAFFRRAGRSLYIASDLPVYYPGEDMFSPDLLAVWDVPLRRRGSYLVVKEGKGLDLAIEVLFRGDRKKDLVDNVARYARLGIREYFVADLAKRCIHGYRLEPAEARRYTPLLGEEVGRLAAQVQRERELAANAQELAANAEDKAAAAAEEARRLRAQLAELLLTLLRVRGLVPTEAQEGLVRTCKDSALLQRWLSRVATASLEELFLDC